MGQAGEDRHLDENSDEETDEEEEDEETEEDEDVTGSDEDEDEDDDDDDNQDEDDEDDDEDEDDDDDDDKNGNGDEANTFQNEPKTPINGGSNIVEDYGVEGIPGDEDLEKGERSKGSDDDAQRSKKTLGLLCCCVVILAIIGTVLGVTLGKNDDESTTTRAAATLPPVPVPATPVPVPATPLPTTAAPTAPLLEYNIAASADTYFFLSGGEDGAFGKEDSLLVQSNDTGATVALMNFDLPFLPPPEVLGFSPRATLVLTLVEQSSRFLEDANATMTKFAPSALTLTTELISGFNGDLEAITSNSSSVFDQLNQTMGPSFQIVPGSKEVSVDISSLLASSQGSESQDIILRRLQKPGSSKILLGLMVDEGEGGGSVRFHSAQSKSPPRIDIDLTAPTSDCPICGEGKNVTNPDVELELPTIGNMTCGELDYVASTGVVTEEQCSLLQPFVNSYCCDSGVDGSAKIYVCELCADGGNITNPTTILPITGQANMTCAEYDGMAKQGLIPAELCAPLQILSDRMCCGIEL